MLDVLLIELVSLCPWKQLESNVPCEEFTDTPKSPEAKHVEEAKDLTIMHSAGEDSVY